MFSGLSMENQTVLRRAVALVLTLSLAFLLTACTPTTAVTTTPQSNEPETQPSETVRVVYDIIEGEFAEGTKWAVAIPDPWNGTLILDLDGSRVGGNQSIATTKWLLDHEYAYGGTSRTQVGYDFVKAVDNLVEVREFVIEHVGEEPIRTIAMGGSRGAFVARLAMEFYPGVFDAAFVTAGGGAGQIAGLNVKLDAKWVLKTLVDPSSPAELVGFADVNIEEDYITTLVDLADSTPEGQARLALAAAIEQFPAWVNAEKPDDEDYKIQYDQMKGTFVMSQFISGTYAMEQLADGVFSWNNGVDYTDMLERSGRKDFVLGMYELAGLSAADLETDLRTLAEAPRISANPAAVAKIEKFLTYTGEIFGPVMNLDNIGDSIDYPPMKLAYLQTLQKAGNEDQLRICWIEGTGHGSIQPIETITAFVSLINCLDNGEWEDTSPEAMNALAAELLVEYPELEGESRFITYEPADLLRTWDFSNWDSYQPE